MKDGFLPTTEKDDNLYTNWEDFLTCSGHLNLYLRHNLRRKPFSPPNSVNFASVLFGILPPARNTAFFLSVISPKAPRWFGFIPSALPATPSVRSDATADLNSKPP